MSAAAELIENAPDLEIDYFSPATELTYADFHPCFDWNPMHYTGTMRSIERVMKENARQKGWVRI